MVLFINVWFFFFRFLDDYYAKFEKRVATSQVDRTGVANVNTNSRMDLGNMASTGNLDYMDDVVSMEDIVSEARGMPEYTMAKRKKVKHSLFSSCT